MAGSLLYEVPGVQLIVQDKRMACWYASAMMLLNWNRLYGTGPRKSDSAIYDATAALYQANEGIRNPEIIELALRLGLKAVPPMSPTVDALTRWLKQYGPLWTNGKKHIVVIAGIRADAAGYSVKVYDPWPGIGVEWRTLSGWYTGFNPGLRGASSRDAGSDVSATFLHS